MLHIVVGSCMKQAKLGEWNEHLLGSSLFPVSVKFWNPPEGGGWPGRARWWSFKIMTKQPLTVDLHQLHTPRSLLFLAGWGWSVLACLLARVKVWREHVKSHASSSSLVVLPFPISSSSSEEGLFVQLVQVAGRRCNLLGVVAQEQDLRTR